MEQLIIDYISHTANALLVLIYTIALILLYLQHRHSKTTQNEINELKQELYDCKEYIAKQEFNDSRNQLLNYKNTGKCFADQP